MDEVFTDPLGAVTPVVVRSAAAQVADQIVEAIREQRLSPGDRLPAERDLAQRFGVSRPTIREALAALELAGIVQSYKGKGTLIIATASQVASWGVEVLPPQVFEARLCIEPVLAALAAEKQYAEDIAHLHEVLAELEAEFEATGAYESDLPVHRAIARAARNPILQRALEDALVHTQSPLWVDLRRRALAKLQTREGHIDETRRVVAHIERGEPAEAAAVWRRHLVFFRDEMLGRTPAETA
jgi:DNA-binding FadR family transcriptional regulator